MLASLMLLVACRGSSETASEQRSTATVFREDGDTGVTPLDSSAGQPDCSVLEKCVVLGLDAVAETSCIDDPSLLEVETYEGIVIDVRLVAEVAATKELPEGSFFTVFPDPTGGCGVTVVSFEQEDAVPSAAVLEVEDKEVEP